MPERKPERERKPQWWKSTGDNPASLKAKTSEISIWVYVVLGEKTLCQDYDGFAADLSSAKPQFQENPCRNNVEES